jgi:hypothetical protein
MEWESAVWKQIQSSLTEQNASTRVGNQQSDDDSTAPQQKCMMSILEKNA